MSLLARAGVAAILIATGAVAGAYLWRLEIATRAIQQLLERQGVPFPSLRVTALDAYGLTVRDVRLGEPAEFEATRLRAEYSWWGERVGLRAVEIEGARSTIDLRGGSVPFGVLQGPIDSLLAPSEPVQRSADTTPSIPQVRITHSVLRMLTAWGAIELLVDLDLGEADERALEGRLQLAAHSPAWNEIRMSSASVSFPLRITPGPQVTTLEWHQGTLQLSDLQAPPVAVDGSATAIFPSGRFTLPGAGSDPSRPSLTTEIEISLLRVRGADEMPELVLRGVTGSVTGSLVEGSFVGLLATRVSSIELVEQRMELRDVVLDVPLPISASSVLLTTAVLGDLDPARHFPAVDLAGSLSRSPADPAWRVNGELEASSGKLRATVQGTVDAESSRGDLRIDLAPVRFRPGGLQPETIYAALGFLTDVDGRLDANARVAWTAKGLHSSEARLQLSGVSFRGPTARIEDLTARLHLTHLLPLRSAPHQELRAAAMHTGGLKFEDARAKFQLLPGAGKSGPSLKVEEASLRLGRGVLRVVDAVLDSATPRELTVRAEKIRLDELFRLLDVAAVAGTGTISGEIPVRIQDQSVEIRGGELRSEGPGVLNVRSEFARSVLESAGQQAALVSRALEDFHYERLRITVDKPIKGTSQLGIHMLGLNPQVLEGQPFDLHINVETDLEPLLRAMSLGLRIPAEWSRRRPGQSK